MIINIIKDTRWINELSKYTTELVRINNNYSHLLGENSNFSTWLLLKNYRQLPLSRSYPILIKEIHSRVEYKLPFYLPNYIPLFLIRELFNDRKDIIIEDVGTGNATLLYYLAMSGFKNFATFEVFMHCPKELFDNIIKISNTKCSINDLNINPVVVNNCSAPTFCFITPGLDIEREEKLKLEGYTTYNSINRNLSNVELFTFYSNREWEKHAEEILPSKGYSFLCRDSDDMSVAWARNDKLKEFTEKLERFKYE